MQIVVAPNPILSEKAKAVLKADKSILHTIAKMKDVLSSAHDPIGVGLAAPQIGKSLQIFIAKPSEKSKPQIFINPKIATTEAQRSLQKTRNRSVKSADSSPRSVHARLEGCLSLPNIWGEVKREEKIKLSFLDDTGKHRTQTFKGLLATIIQHEIDHLHGILFTKRVLEQKGKLYKSRKSKKGEDIYEKLEI